MDSLGGRLASRPIVGKQSPRQRVGLFAAKRGEAMPFDSWQGVVRVVLLGASGYLALIVVMRLKGSERSLR